MENTLEQEYQLSRMEKIFTIFVVFIPILQYYKSPLPSFNLATFLTMFFMIILLIDSRWIIYKDHRTLPIRIYILFILFNYIFSHLSSQFENAANTMTLLRTLVILVSTIYIGSSYFNREFALYILEKLLIASTFFMIIQLFCFYVLHHPITGNIAVLVTSDGYKTASNRATGFYMAPAAFAQSAIMYLVFSLFGYEKMDKNKWKNMAIIMGGIVLSGSGQGYMFLTILLIIWGIYNFFFTSMNTNRLLIGVIVSVVCILGVYLILQTSYAQYAISRIITEDSSGTFGGVALGGRTYTNHLFYELSHFNKVWGIGFGNSPLISKHYYINSLYYYLIECGYVSIGIWIIMLLICFMQGNIAVRLFILFYIIMFYFSGNGRPMMMSFYFSFILFGETRRYNKKWWIYE